MVDVTKKTVQVESAEAPVRARRVGLVKFLQQVRREMEKVTWPSRKETWLTTMMVFIMVGLTMVFFFAVDGVFTYLEQLLIGGV